MCKHMEDKTIMFLAEKEVGLKNSRQKCDEILSFLHNRGKHEFYFGLDHNGFCRRHLVIWSRSLAAAAFIRFYCIFDDFYGFIIGKRR